MWMKLTGVSGSPLLVNFDHVIGVKPGREDDTTDLLLAGSPVEAIGVKVTMEDLESIIEHIEFVADEQAPEG